MINSGTPYRENIIKFDIKFDFEKLLSLQRHSLSLGEFVAHLLPVNSLDDVARNMSKIIDDCFLSRFKEMRPTLQTQMSLFGPADHDEISNSVMATVTRLLELRHMHCHEIDPC